MGMGNEGLTRQQNIAWARKCADMITYVKHPDESLLQPHEVSYAQDHVEYAQRQIENATLALGKFQPDLVSDEGRQQEFVDNLTVLQNTITEVQRSLAGWGRKATAAPFPEAHWYKAADLRCAQSWNPFRVWKNSRNLWNTWANGSNPLALLHMMQDALTRLYHDAGKQNAWTFTGLDESQRPVILNLIDTALQAFRNYADWFDVQPQKATASSYSRGMRLASLTDGVDRDISDVIGLFGPQADESQFPGGKASYNRIIACLTAAQGVLEGNITSDQAAKQVGMATTGAVATTAPAGQMSSSQSFPTSAPTSPDQSSVSQYSAYTYPGEAYNSAEYLRQERIPGSSEWQNEVQNYLSWGRQNGGWSMLLAKLQQDLHSPAFVNAVQQAWQAQCADGTANPGT